MSQGNVEIVRATYEAFDRGGVLAPGSREIAGKESAVQASSSSQLSACNLHHKAYAGHESR